MAFSDNVWYHVTDRSRLERVAKQGLVGRSRAGHANFPVHVKTDAVYLWPELGAAEAWAARSPVKDPVVLQVKDLDTSRIWPDHEAVLNWLADVGDREGSSGEIEDFAQRIVDEINAYDAAHGYEWASDVDRDWEEGEEKYLASYDVFNFVSFEGMVGVLEAMEPNLRAQLARYIATIQRSAVMHEGSIPSERVAVSLWDATGAAKLMGQAQVTIGQWRSHLNEDLRQAEHDEDGVPIPVVHQWHMMHDEQIQSCYSFQGLARPQLDELSGVPEASVETTEPDDPALGH
jgi:hypothetical protein